MLWDKLLPSKLPLSPDVDTTALSKDFPRFTGGNIMKVRKGQTNICCLQSFLTNCMWRSSPKRQNGLPFRRQTKVLYVCPIWLRLQRRKNRVCCMVILTGLFSLFISSGNVGFKSKKKILQKTSHSYITSFLAVSFSFSEYHCIKYVNEVCIKEPPR